MPLFNKIKEILSQIDPENIFFRIVDTGKDIEIILTIESEEDSNKLKDFDKGDGIKFLNSELKLNLEGEGTNLICGDTDSDSAMVKASMDFSQETIAIFVTDDENLKKKVSSKTNS